MANRSGTDAWIQRYLAAWRSNDPTEIKALFSADAEYYTAPYRAPWSGHAEIIAGWEGRAEPPDSWTFEYQVLLESSELGVVQATTRYPESEQVYSNLWLIYLTPAGTCNKYIEYFMLHEA